MRNKSTPLKTMAEVVVSQALELTKLKRVLATALYERRVYRQRWLVLKEKEKGDEQGG